MEIEFRPEKKIEIEDVYMVHLTDFFPREHQILSTYDGNKRYEKNLLDEEIIVKLGEVSKNVIVPSHRHTCHFTLNTAVEATNDGAGDWSGASMAVIEPFKEHKDQFLTYGTGDSYTWGSVNLSSEAVIIIKQEALAQIPEEEREQWNLIVSDEKDIAKAVKAYFRERKIPMVDYVDQAGHRWSEEYVLEENLQKRDKAINFIRDNTFDGKSPIVLTREEFAQILNIQNDPQNILANILPKTKQSLQIQEGTMAPQAFYELVVANGFCLKKDGEIGLKSDEEIHAQIVALEKASKKSIENYLEIEEIYASYMDFISQKAPEEQTEYEKKMLALEKDKVQGLDTEKQEQLTEAEKRAIARTQQRLLRANPKNLTETDLDMVKGLRPPFRINEVEKKYGISFEEGTSQFILSPDDDTYNYAYEQIGQVAQEIARKVAGNKAIVVNENSIEYRMSSGALQDEYIVQMPPQKEEEPYGEYYQRIQSYMAAIQAVMEGKQVVFGEKEAVPEVAKTTVSMAELVKAVGKSEAVRAGTIFEMDQKEVAIQKAQETKDEEEVSLDDE